jgi:hypothetical protein
LSKTCQSGGKRSNRRFAGKKPVAKELLLSGFNKKLLSKFSAMRFVLLQQFPAQFFNCAAEPEPLDHIKQVAGYDAHKKGYDHNPPNGERIRHASIVGHRDCLTVLHGEID